MQFQTLPYYSGLWRLEHEGNGSDSNLYAWVIAEKVRAKDQFIRSFAMEIARGLRRYVCGKRWGIRWTIISHPQTRVNDFDLCQGCEVRTEQLQLRYDSNIPFWLYGMIEYCERSQILPGLVKGTDHFSASFAVVCTRVPHEAQIRSKQGALLKVQPKLEKIHVLGDERWQDWFFRYWVLTVFTAPPPG